MILHAMMTFACKSKRSAATALLALIIAAGSGWQPARAVDAPPAAAQTTPAASPTNAPATPAPAPAPPTPAVLPPEVNDTISKVVGTMEGAEKTLTAIKDVDTDLGRLRDDIDGVISKTTQTADSLRPRLADIQGQIDRLGAAPEKNAPPDGG
jgi:potassium-dependent mechanosensitive channel